MATVRELQAKFTATASGMKSTIQGIKKEIGDLASSTKRTADKISKNLKNAGKQMQDVGKTLTNKITKPATAAAGALAGITLVKGFGRLVGIDTAQAKLKGLGHDAESVEVIMNSALESVKGTAFGMDEAATTAASAVAAGIEPGKELTRYLSLTGDAAAIAGVSLAEMGSIINQVQTSGTAYTDNLNQLADRGIPIYQWLGEVAGVAASEVKGLASEGQISSEMFLKAIENNIGGAAQTIGEESFTAAVSNMWAAVGRLGASFLDGGEKGEGFFSQLKPLINDFTGQIDSLEGVASRAGKKFGEMFASFIGKVKSIKNAYDELSPSVQNIIKKVALVLGTITMVIGPVLTAFGMFLGFIAKVIAGVSSFMNLLTPAGKSVGLFGRAISLLGGPIGIAIGVITTLVGLFIAAYKNSETFRNAVNNMIDSIVNLYNRIVEFLKTNPKIQAFFKGVKDAFTTAKKLIQEAIGAVVGFFQEKFGQLKTFWDEEGANLLQAFKNIFEGIWKVIEPIITFIIDLVVWAFPYIKTVIETAFKIVLGIVKQIWENIKGVINGAIDIILGIIKVFSGLFTGDFSKMWEGIKQIFSGAIEFVWNLIQLSFFGKIIKGVIGFAKKFGDEIRNLWTKIRETFSKAVANIFNKVSETWTNLRTKTTEIFQNIYNGIKGKFDDIVQAAKDLPKKIGDGIGSMASKVTAGVKKVVNKLAETLGKGVNGVIGGINWVLGKIGVSKEIPKWKVPKYADGTKGHPEDGLAMVNDGKGDNSGKELIIQPDGTMSMYEGKNVLAFLEKGTQVISAKNTRKLLESIPAYQGGKGWINKAWGAVKSGAGKVKDSVFNVLDYAKNPSKLLDIALKTLGFKMPKGGNLIGDIAKAGATKIKDGAVGFVKNRIEQFAKNISSEGVKKVTSKASSALTNVGQFLSKNLKGFADGGIVSSKQLAWIAEGGWAESIISHDPAKKANQRRIWERTGDMLGFADNKEIISLLKRIAYAIENGDEQILNALRDRAGSPFDANELARVIAPYMDRQLGRRRDNKVRAEGGF